MKTLSGLTMPLQIGSWHLRVGRDGQDRELESVAPDQFSWRIAEHPLDRRAGVKDAAIAVQEQHPVEGVLDQGAKTCCALPNRVFCAFALGDVFARNEYDHMLRLTRSAEGGSLRWTGTSQRERWAMKRAMARQEGSANSGFWLAEVTPARCIAYKGGNVN